MVRCGGQASGWPVKPARASLASLSPVQRHSRYIEKEFINAGVSSSLPVVQEYLETLCPVKNSVKSAFEAMETFFEDRSKHGVSNFYVSILGCAVVMLHCC